MKGKYFKTKLHVKFNGKRCGTFLEIIITIDTKNKPVNRKKIGDVFMKILRMLRMTRRIFLGIYRKRIHTISYLEVEEIDKSKVNNLNKFRCYYKLRDHEYEFILKPKGRKYELVLK